MSEPLDTESLLQAVRANPRYASINPDLIRTLIERQKGMTRQPREIVKAVRSKLHQVGGAYLDKPIDYTHWAKRLAQLPHDLQHPRVKDFCRQMMALHTSTRERIPILERFYAETLTALQPLRSLLDLACGLNPLALPWLPITAETRIWACDIYSDQITFLQQFFDHFGIHGQAFLCDLTSHIPQQPVQLALLLKSIPCLEQLDKAIFNRMLEELRAEVLLVSFPAQSIGGRGKGMRQNYRQHFEELIRGRQVHFQTFDFPNELVFLLSPAT